MKSSFTCKSLFTSLGDSSSRARAHLLGTALCLSLLGATGSLSACGSSDSSEVTPSLSDVTLSVLPSAAEGAFFGLTDTSATATVTSISGCASGYTKSSYTGSTIQLYKNDRSCVVNLKQFTLAGRVYTTTNSAGAASVLQQNALGGAAGSQAIFTAATGPALLVGVDSQLASPFIGSQIVAFSFQTIDAGGSQAASNSLATDTLQVGGLEAPNLSLSASGFVLTAIDAATGKGTFSVSLACAQALTAAKECATAGGVNQAVSSMKATLVTASTFVAAGSPTYAEALAAISSASGVLAITNAHVAAGAIQIPLTQATGPLGSNQDMVLIVSYTDSGKTAFRYFDVNIIAPVNP